MANDAAAGLNISPSAFRAIGKLRAMRAFERRHLHCVQTVEDRDLLCEIGHRQATHAPLTLKQLLLLGIGSIATVQRRLRRLRHAGCIQHARGGSDRRTMELTLTPRVLQVFQRYADLLSD
jgi:predicted MarR family transcription regulator